MGRRLVLRGGDSVRRRVAAVVRRRTLRLRHAGRQGVGVERPARKHVRRRRPRPGSGPQFRSRKAPPGAHRAAVRDFSVSLWVKSAPGAIQGTPIAANGTLRESGWQILARENGSWAVKLRSGETSFEYAPPLRKINDGAWHQLAFTIDTGRGLARFYYDGRCVAIYNIDGLGPLDSGKWTVFGGSDDSFDSGDAGMIEAFNGWIDGLYLSDTVRSEADLAAEFAALQPARC